MFIYLIENTTNKKAYVGQTSHPDRRFHEHATYGKGLRGNAMQKHGSENCESHIREKSLSKEETDAREIYWIKKLNTLSPEGYNLRTGGHSNSDHSLESRKKMSSSQRGNKNALGIKRSEKTKRKISEAKKGKKMSPKFKEKIRKSLLGNKRSLGFKHSPEVKAARSSAYRGQNNPFYGRRHTEETKEKIRKAVLERTKQRSLKRKN